MTSFMREAPKSVGEMLDICVTKHGLDHAFKYPQSDDSWASITWSETKKQVHELAAALLSFGLDPESRVAIVSSTRIEWILMDLAINCAKLATTTIYPNTQAKDFEHILTHSQSQILVAENLEQLRKLAETSIPSAQLKAIVLLDDKGYQAHQFSFGKLIHSWTEFQEIGVKYLSLHPSCVVEAIAACDHNTLATLIYTSGTTGKPKGVELTHQNWIYEGLAMDQIKIVRKDMVHYLWLPLSHVFGKCLISVQLVVGFCTAVDGRTDKIMANMAVIRPHLMCGVPRIFEKVRATVMTKNNGIKKRISRWAFAVGRESRAYRLSGKPLPKNLAMRYALADKMVFSKLKAAMGGRLEFFISGSAKLSQQVQNWFYSAGILILEGYGSTETSAVAFVNTVDNCKFGTVGQPAPGTQVRLAEDGEILLRGAGIMRGYHKDLQLSAEALEDGWFHTGDIGEIDSDGFLKITDRKKDLLKTSSGKYVAPQKVESIISANIPYISQVVAVGDGRKYISALVTLEPEALYRWAKRRGKADLSYAELSQLPEIYASIGKLMAKANEHLERWETVKKFAILDHEFSVESGGVTASMKVKRAYVTKKYAEIVDSLYEIEDIEE